MSAFRMPACVIDNGTGYVQWRRADQQLSAVRFMMWRVSEIGRACWVFREVGLCVVRVISLVVASQVTELYRARGEGVHSVVGMGRTPY